MVKFSQISPQSLCSKLVLSVFIIILSDIWSKLILKKLNFICVFIKKNPTYLEFYLKSVITRGFESQGHESQRSPNGSRLSVKRRKDGIIWPNVWYNFRKNIENKIRLHSCQNPFVSV